MNTRALSSMIRVMEETRVAHKGITCAQFMMVLYAVQSGGITQKELADKLEVTEGAISRNLKTLGPEGTGCLAIENRKVVADPHVIEHMTALLADA